MLLLLPVVGDAQHAPEEGPGAVPTFQAETRSVVIDVVVRTPDGQPVRGLKAGDFRVAEDGNPQKITSFEEHGGAALSEATSSAPREANGVSPSSQESGGGPVNLVLLDSLNTPLQDQLRMRQHVAAFLKEQQRGASVAIFVLGAKLRMIHGFSNDPAVLVAALEDKKTGFIPERTANASVAREDSDDKTNVELLNSMHAAPPGSVEAAQLAGQTRNATEGNNRVSTTVLAMETLARGLATIPDRKNLIWFSGSFPLPLFPQPGAKVAATAEGQSRELKKAADALAFARVAIYPVNALGVGVSGVGDATDHYSATAGDLSREDRASAANAAAMTQLAAETGGTAIPNSNDLEKALATAVQAGSHYYSLSYTPAEKGAEGSFRSIHVTLTEAPDDILAYRSGYYAVTQPRQMQPAPDALQVLLLPHTASPLQLSYQLHVGPGSERAALSPTHGTSDGAAASDHIEFTIWWKDAEPARGGIHLCSLRLGAVAYDSAGKALARVQGTASTELSPTAYASVLRSGVHSALDIEIPPGTATLTTGVYDTVSHQAGRMEIPLSAPTITPAQDVAAIGTAAPAKPAEPAAAPVSATAAPSPRGEEVAPALVHRSVGEVQQTQEQERRVTLDVVVTDAQGAPVKGLTQRDLTVTANGHPQPLTSFAEVSGPTADPPTALVLVVDALNSSFQDLNAERQGIAKYLRRNGGQLSLPVSVVYVSQGGAKMDTPTRDGDALAHDVEGLPTAARMAVAEGADGEIQQFQRSMGVLGQITTYAGSKPGRTLLLWLGPGWPTLAQHRFRLNESDRKSFFTWKVDLANRLRENRVTLYSIVPADLWSPRQVHPFAYQEYLRSVETLSQASPANLSVQVLAQQSGGLVLGPTGNVEAEIARCVADSGTYYQISFASQPGQHANEYNGLVVRLDRPGLTVRTNAGFYAQP